MPASEECVSAAVHQQTLFSKPSHTTRLAMAERGSGVNAA